MTVGDLIRLVENRLATLNGLRATAYLQGEADRVSTLDIEIQQTESTLQSLRGL